GKDYGTAYDQFIEYREKWPRADFAATALFRAGVCRFGAEDYAGAMAIFKAFIVNYDKDALMPEALSMYGDLLAADGEIDAALESYDRVVALVLTNYKATTDPLMKKQITAPATYAVMQSAQALRTDADFQKEAEVIVENYHQIIAKVESYMKTFGDDADWAQAVYWIGRAQLALGETDKAVSAYLDVVVKYGTDPYQEGVASIVLDLAQIIKTQLSSSKYEQAMASIQKARAETSAPTLQILLDVLVAEIKDTQLELGRALLASEKDLSVLPPSGLSLMCSILYAQGDYYRAEEFFNYFSEHYDGSMFMLPAYRLRVADLYRQKKYDEAFKLVDQALDIYGATEDTGWVPLMKGNIQFAQGKYKDAEATYNLIFGERVWRGAVSAEAMLQMAEAWYAQENYEKAFAFFQRTYLLYKAYDGGRWAAEGYLRSVNCLAKLGKTNDVMNTYRAMLQDEYVRNLPQTAEAKKALGPEETAKILSGKTNATSSVKGEVTPK
ncbi:MAG: tetratricopeptide repeat protein, partial [Kiritimatiellaceae bacterium]|nr:tetratricopeptide repeat protein [Kiritimatiellaceae bacterium]